jgi:hypothetical protein
MAIAAPAPRNRDAGLHESSGSRGNIGGGGREQRRAGRVTD